MKKLFLLLLILTNNIIQAVYIKVLLMELENGVVLIEHPKQLAIQRLTKSRIIYIPELTITFNNGELFLNNKPYLHPEQLIITSENNNESDGPLKLAGISYNGYLRLIVVHKKLYIINYLELEDYISSVIKTEGWPGWANRFYEIQAIISRTYALNKILNNRKSSKIYDICNTNLHQTYKGCHNLEPIKKAIESTAGLFLAYENKPIDAMYDCCCGGVTPSLIDGISNKNLSYLARDKPCLYCKNTKIYLWKHEIVVEDFIKILQKKIPHLKHINNIQIIESDKAGIVKKIKIFDKKKSYIITGKDLYSLIKEIKSFIFDLKLEKNIIKINGKGYGHHRGLCQWGAHEMVKQDKSCQEVLDFYYPGTVLKKIATTQL